MVDYKQGSDVWFHLKCIYISCYHGNVSWGIIGQILVYLNWIVCHLSDVIYVMFFEHFVIILNVSAP